jgi:hypothetical protein
MTKAEDEPRQRRHAVDVADFCQRKGAIKALQNFRKRKQTKRDTTARALRTYSKVMKHEGFVPGQGASRKRNSDTATSTTNDNDSKQPQQQQQQQQRGMIKQNPFSKSIQQAKDKKVEHEQVQLAQEASQKEKQKKLRGRRERTKLLTQRTRRGQPIMKNVVQDILNQLEKGK